MLINKIFFENDCIVEKRCIDTLNDVDVSSVFTFSIHYFIFLLVIGNVSGY